MHTSISRAIHNIRGGLLGVLAYLGITAIIGGAAFMAAFGNDTLAARLVLAIAALYFGVAHPLWGVPVSYVLGAFFLARDAGCTGQSGDEK